MQIFDDLAAFRQRLSWSHTFTALKYRNYRLWFFGQMTSLLERGCRSRPRDS